MSIASQITLLNNTKQGIKTAINNKGVTVTDEPFAEYPDKIRLIPNGGGTYESQIILYLEGKLENVIVPSGTTSIGTGAFYDGDAEYNKLETINIPSSVTTIGDYAFYGNKNITEVTLPSTTTSIGAGAFEECDNLLSITVLATVPPTLGAAGLSTTNNDTLVYVPAQSVLAYQTADVWQYYSHMITAIP